ncbi:MAG: ferritin family protein [SAR324 cluster bacterium]|nr:ferritin family protein [SAR324 cluster bacterium]
MSSGDFQSIVEYAITLEQKSSDNYKKLSEQVTAPEIKKVFLELSAQEIGHKKKLESIEAKGNLPASKNIHPDDDLKISDYIVEIDSSKPDLSYAEALALGMQMEDASLKLYRSLATRVEDPELIELFNYLAKEEAKHKHSFESEFDDLMG